MFNKVFSIGFSTSNCIRLSTACGVSTNATLSLTECVKQELKLEKLTSEPLPKFTNFSVSISGCCATLQRTYKNEQLVINFEVAKLCMRIFFCQD